MLCTILLAFMQNENYQQNTWLHSAIMSRSFAVSRRTSRHFRFSYFLSVINLPVLYSVVV